MYQILLQQKYTKNIENEILKKALKSKNHILSENEHKKPVPALRRDG
jgi:hypothetical protein